MRRLITLLLAGVMFNPAQAQDPSAVKPQRQQIIGVPWVKQGRSPFCAAAATLSAVNAQGAALKLRPFVAQLQVHADGIAWFDLAEALRPLGFNTYVFHGDIDDIRHAVNHGTPPIVSVRRGAGRHAIAITGYTAQGLVIMDPVSGEHTLPMRTFNTWRADGGPMMVMIREASAESVALYHWREQTLIYRAEFLTRQAEGAPEPRGALHFIDRALKERPEWPQLHMSRAALLAKLERKPEACAALVHAMGLLGQPLTPGAESSPRAIQQLAAKLGCRLL